MTGSSPNAAMTWLIAGGFAGVLAGIAALGLRMRHGCPGWPPRADGI